jgi:phospholipid transport system substrate-binding protein
MRLPKVVLLAALLFTATGIQSALAQVEAPDALVKRVSTDVLDAVRADPTIQPGNVGKVVELVDAKILPSFDFARMTASAVGPRWNDATPEQKASLEEQFKILLVRAYSGALSQARDRTVEIQPLRSALADSQVVVKTIVRGGREPVGLDFRLFNEGTAWKITDVNVGGLWLVENYRGSFAQEITNGGIDGLIGKLGERNKSARN